MHLKQNYFRNSKITRPIIATRPINDWFIPFVFCACVLYECPLRMHVRLTSLRLALLAKPLLHCSCQLLYSLAPRDWLFSYKYELRFWVKAMKYSFKYVPHDFSFGLFFQLRLENVIQSISCYLATTTIVSLISEKVPSLVILLISCSNSAKLDFLSHLNETSINYKEFFFFLYMWNNLWCGKCILGLKIMLIHWYCERLSKRNTATIIILMTYNSTAAKQ